MDLSRRFPSVSQDFTVLDQLRDELKKRTQSELVVMAKKLGLKALQRNTKDELIQAILALSPKKLRAHFYPTWWQRNFYAVASWASIVSLIIGILVYFFPPGWSSPTPAPEIKVFLSGFYGATEKPKSDFELARGKKTLLLVRIPRLREPANRFVLGTVIVRPVNLGTRSMSGAQLTTAFPDRLWHPSIGRLDRESISALSGNQRIESRVVHSDGRWYEVRTLPRLDPMTGAPLPVSFVLQVSGVTPDKKVDEQTQGELEIRMFGPDWDGLSHVLDVRCIPADSAEEFLESSRTLAFSLQAKGYPNIPVVLAETGGSGIVAGDGGPTIIQAKVASFIKYKNGSLREFIESN
jgi:hypothetical protein